MSIEIDEMVQDHEKRITNIEVSEARVDERLNALVQSTNNLRVGMWIFSLIMLLTMVWQILGRQGFQDVTGAVGLSPTQTQTQTAPN